MARTSHNQTKLNSHFLDDLQMLMARIFGDQQYKDDAARYCDNWVYGQPRTPKGLVYINDWGSLRHAANAAYGCLLAADLGLPNTYNYRAFAKQQINYALGDSGRSYVLGFGNNPPQESHHRAASVGIFIMMFPIYLNKIMQIVPPGRARIFRLLAVTTRPIHRTRIRRSFTALWPEDPIVTTSSPTPETITSRTKWPSITTPASKLLWPVCFICKLTINYLEFVMLTNSLNYNTRPIQQVPSCVKFYAKILRKIFLKFGKRTSVWKRIV